MDETRPRNYSKSATRALEVMNYLAVAGRAVRAVEIAEALNIARSSADQLLKTMVLEGYLVLSLDNKTYFPSLRMAAFGHCVAGWYPAIHRYEAIVEDIHNQTGAIVTLSMHNGYVMQLTSITSSDLHVTGYTVGRRLPVVGTVIGSAALTTYSQKTVSRLIDRARQRQLVGRTVPCGSSFADDIHLFRMKGYVSAPTPSDVESEDGPRSIPLWSIAMPLPGERDTPGAVLGFCAHAAEAKANEWDLVNLMRRSIREHLGH